MNRVPGEFAKRLKKRKSAGQATQELGARVSAAHRGRPKPLSDLFLLPRIRALAVPVKEQSQHRDHVI